MIQTIRVHGTEKRLYELIAPLVMDPDVLRANNNYPFKTTEHYVWFIAIDDGRVLGFLPVEHRSAGAVINNYYVGDDNEEVLGTLLQSAVKATEEETEITAVVLVHHQSIFEKNGFTIDSTWKRYVKMRRN